MTDRNVPCPVCRTLVNWDSADAHWRPFCGERCQTIDLGGWLQEENRIPGVEMPAEFLDELDTGDDPANE